MTVNIFSKPFLVFGVHWISSKDIGPNLGCCALMEGLSFLGILAIAYRKEMHKAIHITHWPYACKAKKSWKIRKSWVQYPSPQKIEFMMDWMFGWNCIIVWVAMGIVHLTYFPKVDAIPIMHRKDVSQILIGAIPIPKQYKNWNCIIVWVCHGYCTFDSFSQNRYNIHHKPKQNWNCIVV